MTASDDLHAEGLALARAGRIAEAADRLERLVALAPDHARGWAMLGQLRLELSDPRAALTAFDHAIALEPARAANHLNRGAALARLEDFAQALSSYDRALELDPAMAQAHGNRAQALNELERPDDAAAAARAALALQPGHAAAWGHLGNALYSLARYEEALEAFRSGLAVRPGDYDALCNAGMALTALGRYGEAAAVLDAAVEARPAEGLARYRRAHARLTVGDFGRGWADYESRWSTPLFTRSSSGVVTPETRSRLALAPRPADFEGQRVLVLAEQGIGDQILFASILPDLASVARGVTLACDPRLVSLFRLSFPGVACVANEDVPALDREAFDLTVAIGSLPHAWRRDDSAFTGRPYLAPRTAATEGWKARLAERPARRRIGISWRGGTKRTGAAARSLPLARLASALSGPGTELVSLQYGDVEAEVEAANAALDRPVRLFDPAEIDDFEDLAGLVCALDLIVTVQTAVVHLSGALGRPALVMVPKKPEWRYGAAGERMPWYGSVRLFRQASDEDWSPVLDRVAQAAAAMG
ncbi:tetratricopeptide repeat protein [Phenylobacterium sp.]|uniref:tetratricopeptide repeat protein n=1 Tax=Phenylobacterium sp. TaxID=1871053 RepID=UPI0039195330